MTVVVIVLAAVYVKWNGEGSEALFRSSDIYILAGALLALVVLRMLRRRRGDDVAGKSSGKK